MENSTEKQTFRPDEVMSKLGIKKSKYYEILNELSIKAFKDSTGKSYLIEGQVEEIEAYLSGNPQIAEDEDLDNSSLVVADDNNLAISANNICVEHRDPIKNIEEDRLVRNAAQLKARELAAPDLVVRAIADRMTEEDLPEDLKEKVEAVRESVNPKWTPESLADGILARYRSSRSR